MLCTLSEIGHKGSVFNNEAILHIDQPETTYKNLVLTIFVQHIIMLQTQVVPDTAGHISWSESEYKTLPY